MKIHSFQPKCSILWPHSWHSLFKWSNIMHMGAYWNGKQCWLRKFSSSLHGNFIFHFSIDQNEFFCEGPTIYLLQNWTRSFSYNTRPYLMHNWPNGWVPKAFIHLAWKRQVSANSVGSGSNLNCSCLIFCSLFFQKIISRYICIYLIRETSKCFPDSPTS